MDISRNPAGLVRLWGGLAALNGLIAVGAGAWAAHGLYAEDAAQLATFHVAVRYQMWHALALLAVAALTGVYGASRLLSITGLGFSAGIALFCGSLYTIVLTSDPTLGAAAPAGGMLLMAGWLSLIIWAISGRTISKGS